LPQAEKGVRELQKLYGAGRAKIYLGAEASEETIKAEAGDYDILHFAAHAIFSNRNPMYSSIVLAQPGEGASEDGMLEAWEIMKLDLRAEQALLPACETARGRVGAGEGVIGLTWALFVAGAPTTAVSQWKVRADATAALMAEYHRQLQNAAAPSSKAQALRQASLKLLRNKLYGHPHFWAGIALVGDGF
jgi:CHAT domain-containing protein